MAQNQDKEAEFQVAKSLRERIFQIPLLPQTEIVPRFAAIDAVLYPMAHDLAYQVPAVREYFVDIVQKVASGNTLGKNYFNKQDNEDDKGKKKEVLKKSEKRVLSSTFALLRHTHNPAKFCDILNRAGFMRGVMEEAIEFFLEKIERYEEITRNMKDAELAHSFEFLRFEQELEVLLKGLGVPYHEHHFLDTLIPQIEARWADYLETRHALVSPYFRKVYTIAMGYSKSDSQTLDNFQNGVIGLMRAYKCYTPSRFAAFSLVAENWIKQAILLHIKTEVNFIKLPIANWHSHQKLEKLRIKLEQHSGGNVVTVEMVAAEAKMAVDKVKKIYEHVKLAKVLSLNVPTSNEEDQNEGPSWAMESVTDERNVHEQLEIQAEFETVKKVVTEFDSEETIIFALISGCLDLIENTELSPIDIEKERIRQIGVRHGIEITFK